MRAALVAFALLAAAPGSALAGDVTVTRFDDPGRTTARSAEPRAAVAVAVVAAAKRRGSYRLVAVARNPQNQASAPVTVAFKVGRCRRGRLAWAGRAQGYGVRASAPKL